jgi:hypothetical protein
MVDENVIYYFLCPVQDKYYTLFIAWLGKDLIQAFQQLDEENKQIYIKIIMGSHTFVTYVDRSIFLVEFKNNAIFEFASDNEKLELFLEMEKPPELDMPLIVNFPRYFNKGIEPLLKFKLGPEFSVQQDGAWLPLKI